MKRFLFNFDIYLWINVVISWTQLIFFFKFFLKVHVEFSDDNKIIVEGPTNMIPKVIDSLKKAIDCYVSTELVVDPKFFKHIIGKNGSNSKLNFVVFFIIVCIFLIIIDFYVFS